VACVTISAPDEATTRPGTLTVERVGFAPGAVEYLAGWDLQRSLHADVVEGRAADTVLLLEHQPVYTAGRRTEPLDRPVDGTPVIDVDRGGKIVCADVGVATAQVPGRSGVWVPGEGRGVDRKIAAIGIRVSQGVTMHGFALNCDCDLEWFDRIVPCGIRDAEVTTLSRELGRDVTVAEILPIVERHLDRLVAW
jgi:lipoyl(octanoyl) transferase